MTATRPVLWEGEFECTCGHRAHAEVLGRRGHRYDELEIREDEQPTPEEREELDQFIHESYATEGRGVIDVLACPKCGARPGMRRELRRMALWLAVLSAAIAATSGILYAMGDRTPAVGALIAGAVAILARTYTFLATIREATDRVRLSALRSTKDEAASSG